MKKLHTKWDSFFKGSAFGLDGCENIGFREMFTHKTNLKLRDRVTVDKKE
jgi:hypothetical protein